MFCTMVPLFQCGTGWHRPQECPEVPKTRKNRPFWLFLGSSQVAPDWCHAKKSGTKVRNDVLHNGATFSEWHQMAPASEEAKTPKVAFCACGAWHQIPCRLQRWHQGSKLHSSQWCHFSRQIAFGTDLQSGQKAQKVKNGGSGESVPS